MNFVEPLKIAKAALINEDGNLLVLTRSDEDQKRAGRFDFPGGKVDEGESAEQAIAREINEEIGLEINVNALRLVYTKTIFYEGISTARFLFIGQIKKNSPITLSEEHQDFTWMSFEDALNKHKHPVWIGGLEYLLENKQLTL